MNSHPPLATPFENTSDAAARPVRLDRSLEKLGLWRATDMLPRAEATGAGAHATAGQPSRDLDAQAQRQPGQRRFGRQQAMDVLDPSAGDQAAGDAPLVSGYPQVDQLFPDGHWPAADLVEVLCDLRGVGELRLLMPVLARLSRLQARWVAWIAPPHIPYAPALAACGVDIRRVLLIHPRTERERLWAMEQALKSGTCSAVLGWPGQPLRQQDIRRLQLAATQGNTMGLLFRPESAALEASPAPFRLVLRSAETVDPAAAQPSVTPLLRVKMLKRRGGWATEFVPVALALSPAAPVAGTKTGKEAGKETGKETGRETGREMQNADVRANTDIHAPSEPRSPALGRQTPAAQPAAARETTAPERSPVESLSGLQRHLAQWRASMQRTASAATPSTERREVGETYGLFGSFDPGRLVIGRRRGAPAERPMTAKPGTVRTTTACQPATSPVTRRQVPDGTKPAF